jgi:hypothetical protein
MRERPHFVVGGCFLCFVHFDFSLSGDYRDDHIHRSGFTELQAKLCAHPHDLEITATR